MMTYPLKQRTVWSLIILLGGGVWISLRALESLEQHFLKSVEQPQTLSEQHLPISAQFKIRNDVIRLEVAQTSQQREIGLMERKTLSPNRGMLFLVSPPRNVQIWIRGMKLPLDLVFLKGGVIKAIKPQVPPCAAQNCPTYSAGTEVNQVIELAAGRATELGLKVGGRLEVSPLPDSTR